MIYYYTVTARLQIKPATATVETQTDDLQDIDIKPSKLIAASKSVFTFGLGLLIFLSIDSLFHYIYIYSYIYIYIYTYIYIYNIYI